MNAGVTPTTTASAATTITSFNTVAAVIAAKAWQPPLEERVGGKWGDRSGSGGEGERRETMGMSMSRGRSRSRGSCGGMVVPLVQVLAVRIDLARIALARPESQLLFRLPVSLGPYLVKRE